MKMRHRSAGFTLVEAIMVIVILGILSAMVAVFIRAPILGYRDAAARADLSDQADLALRRIARDLRAALPNSIRVLAAKDAAASTDIVTLEFLQTVSGGRYLAAEDNVADLPVLDFEGTQPSPNQFTVIAPPSSFAKVKAGDLVVVHNLGEGFEPANAYLIGKAGSMRNAAAITAVGAAQNTTLGGTGISAATRAITLASNPFKDQDPAVPSPDMRFQVVRGPVSYVCKAQGSSYALWRVWGYAIASAQAADPAGGQRSLIASGLDGCGDLFNYSSAANLRSGLVVVTLKLRALTDNVTVRLLHQVHVDNTP